MERLGVPLVDASAWLSSIRIVYSWFSFISAKSTGRSSASNGGTAVFSLILCAFDRTPDAYCCILCLCTIFLEQSNWNCLQYFPGFTTFNDDLCASYHERRAIAWIMMQIYEKWSYASIFCFSDCVEFVFICLIDKMSMERWMLLSIFAYVIEILNSFFIKKCMLRF